MQNLPLLFNQSSFHRYAAALVIALASVLATVAPGLALAQEVSVPTADVIAAGIADNRHRENTLYQVIAVARLLDQSESTEAEAAAGLLQANLDWLNRLRAHYRTPVRHSPVLDPAAWLIHLELEGRDLNSNRLVSPLGPELGVYLEQVFDRSNENLAAVMLPELIWQVEPLATTIWHNFLEKLESDEALENALIQGHGALVESWSGTGGMDADILPLEELFDDLGRSMAVIAADVSAAGPPDLKRLQEVRYRLLIAMPELDGVARHEAQSFLRIAELLDGLNERRYFSFAEGLLAIVTRLLDPEAAEVGDTSRVAAWLAEYLPPISNRFAREFAVVDPRINSALAAAFDVVRDISRQGEGGQDTMVLRRELADAAAQLALLIPDLDYYFDLPVRDSIVGGMDACTGIVARREEDGSPAMTRELYDDCQQGIVDLADREARTAALAGDPDGPFGDEELSRELEVTSGQRINYGIGYLHERFSTGCAEPEQPLPNPLEWSALATLLAWFAEQSPIYFQTPENEARLQRMRAIGNELLRVVAEQVDCFAGAGAVLNDPVSRSLVDYRDALVALSSGINGAIFDFRGQLLAPGADVALQRDATQPTAYRPDDLMIGPCDPGNVCEMSGELASTRALLGLFPDPYLVADQTGLGNVEICYERMAWVNRRSEYVRADDTNVANYFGHLQFELKGRYRSGSEVSEIFGFRFTSPNEQHYLFAGATDEVLADSCAVNWIGQRIVTPLRGDRGGVVPNRLTYLAAPRMLPSRLLANNWERGAEWRDWFITGIGVEQLDLGEPNDISGGVNQHLQSLHRTEQAAVYQSIARPASRGESLGIESLFGETTRLNTIKLLIRHQFMLFYPKLLSESDELRSAVAGQGGLLDLETITRFRADNVPVNTLNSIAFERLERLQEEWQAQPEATRRTGSIAVSLAHAMMRLNALHQAFFAEPVSPVVVEPDG
jgi:hypothetical protein